MVNFLILLTYFCNAPTRWWMEPCTDFCRATASFPRAIDAVLSTPRNQFVMAFCQFIKASLTQPIENKKPMVGF